MCNNPGIDQFVRRNRARQDLNFGSSRASIAIAFVTFILAGSAGAAKAASTAVLTHHYDNFRTGWNQTETILTPQNVASSQFGLIAATLLDAQVDAQPLIMPNQTITGGPHPGTYEVVYVAT